MKAQCADTYTAFIANRTHKCSNTHTHTHFWEINTCSPVHTHTVYCWIHTHTHTNQRAERLYAVYASVYGRGLCFSVTRPGELKKKMMSWRTHTCIMHTCMWWWWHHDVQIRTARVLSDVRYIHLWLDMYVLACRSTSEVFRATSLLWFGVPWAGLIL